MSSAGTLHSTCPGQQRQKCAMSSFAILRTKNMHWLPCIIIRSLYVTLQLLLTLDRAMKTVPPATLNKYFFKILLISFMQREYFRFSDARGNAQGIHKIKMFAAVVRLAVQSVLVQVRSLHRAFHHGRLCRSIYNSLHCHQHALHGYGKCRHERHASKDINSRELCEFIISK